MQPPQQQQSLFIEHDIDGTIIPQRPADGYINATAMCNKVGKAFEDYLSIASDYLEALSAKHKTPVSALIQQLDGDAKVRGIWVHPEVAIHLAQWLSPEFSVQVTEWVVDWMSGNISGRFPAHIRRYVANRSKIPFGYFSMLDESMYSLVAPLEEAGYILPDNLIPDISFGRMFSDFLRKEGIDPNTFPTYEHEFTDGKRPTVSARLYPNEHLGKFRNYLAFIWIPEKAFSYFKKKDTNALPYLEKAFPKLPAPKTKAGK